MQQQGSCGFSIAVPYVYHIIRWNVKNFTMKTMEVYRKEVTEKAYIDQLPQEKLDADITPKIAPDIFEIVYPAEPERDTPERVAGNNNPKVI
jgi:hypothetical protein